MPYKNIELNPAQFSPVFTAQESHFYKGFSTVAWSKTRTTELYDLELIKQDLLNNFNTRQGERVMQPLAGTVIWSLIFEPFTESVKQSIADDISRICNSDPRVIPIQIDVDEQEYGMLLELTLQLVNSNQTLTLALNFDRELGFITQ
jgi:phage baseplate assembly protein W